MKYCKHCGAELYDDAYVCTKCGRSVVDQQHQPQTVVVQQPVAVQQKQNGCGIAGFVLALLGVVFCWLGIVTFILLSLGFILSIVGICVGKHKGQSIGLAIAGLVLSLIDLIIAIVIITVAGSIIGGLVGSLSLAALC